MKAVLADPAKRREILSRAIYATINAEIHPVTMDEAYAVYDRVQAEKKEDRGELSQGTASHRHASRV
jgi:hypothetical protein